MHGEADAVVVEGLVEPAGGFDRTAGTDLAAARLLHHEQIALVPGDGHVLGEGGEREIELFLEEGFVGR